MPLSYKQFMDRLGRNPPIPFTDFSQGYDKKIYSRERKRLMSGSEPQKVPNCWDPSDPIPVGESYSPHDHFPRRDASSEDGEYDIRVFIEYKDNQGRTTLSLFPPTQLQTTDNKYDFNRQLTAELKSLKDMGFDVVEIHRKGDPRYESLMKKIPSPQWNRTETFKKMRTRQKGEK